MIEEIAAGGMGVLWRAHHVVLDLDVAIKVLSVDPSADAIERFKREAQACARLRSPNIVQVLDSGAHEGHPYLVMELLRGLDLDARIRAEGKLSLEETDRIIQAVARAMQIAHDADIVHRDLKPANIFLETVGDEAVVKVLDFGVAKDLRPTADPSQTTGSGVVGSPSYMSPEQIWGEKVDRRSDVWAMGVVTFEMLTGRCPFADDTLAKIFDRIIRAPIPRVRDFNPSLPPSLDVFFDRALARTPLDRIASAREFAAAFRRALTAPEALGEAASGRPHARAPDPELGASTQAAPFAKTERPPAPSIVEAAPERSPGLVPRSRAPLWLGILAFALLGLGVHLLLRGPSKPAPRREASDLRATAAPSTADASARDAPSAVPTDVGPPASGSVAPTAVSAKTSRAAEPRRPPATAGSSPRVDPRFGIPLPP